MAEERHKFHTSIEVPWTFESVGREAEELVLRQAASGDENAAAGAREIRKYARPVAEVLSAAGALAAVQGQAEGLSNLSKAGAAAQKLLDTKAGAGAELSVAEQALLARNHKYVEDMLLIRKGIEDAGGIKIYQKVTVPGVGGGVALPEDKRVKTPQAAPAGEGCQGSSPCPSVPPSDSKECRDGVAGEGRQGPSPCPSGQTSYRQVLNEKATKKMEEFVGSEKFFDLRKRASVRAVTWYLEQSSNDVLHNLEVRHLSCKDIRKLLKQDARGKAGSRAASKAIGLSETDRAALRVLLRHKGREKIRRQYAARMGFVRQKALRKLLSQVQNAQGDFSKGAAFTAAAYVAAGGAALLTARTVILTERFWKKHTRLGRLVWRGERLALRKAGEGAVAVARQGGRGIRYAYWEAKKAVKGVGTRGRSSRPSAGDAGVGGGRRDGKGPSPRPSCRRPAGASPCSSCLRSARGNSGVGSGVGSASVGSDGRVKAALAEARKKAGKIAASKAAKRAKAAARTAGKIGKTAAGVALTPFKVGRMVLSGIYRAVSGVRKWALVGGGLCIILYLFLMLFFHAVMAMEDEQEAVRAHVIEAEDEGWVARTARELISLFEAKVEEAIRVGETYDRYTLHFVDGAGAPLGAYSDGGLRDSGEVPEESQRNLRREDESGGEEVSSEESLRNLEGVPEESQRNLRRGESSGWDIPNNAKDVLVAAYVMMGGAEAFIADTLARDALVENLWAFLNPAAEYVPSEVYYCGGCITAEDGSSYCPGHQDVDITIRILFLSDLQGMEEKEILAGLTDPMYQERLLAFFDAGGWMPDGDDNDNILWASNLYSGDWITLYGADPNSVGGYATGTALSEEDIRAILANTETSEAAKQAISYALSKVGCAYDQDFHASTSVDIFDCSSLCYRAYRQAGVDISNGGIYSAAEELRVAERRGQIVPKTELRPGDLIFYTTDSAVREGRHKGCGHVAMYVGDGKMVEAKGRLYGVTVSKLRTEEIVGIARVAE